MTNQGKKYNKEETREVVIEAIKTSEKEQKQIMEKLTNFMKKRGYMFYELFILLSIVGVICLIIYLLIYGI